DRTAGAAALVGGSDHAGVGPDLRVQRVAGTEHADDGPVLAADVQRVARLQPGELALRADAGDQLAAAGLEPAALDQLDVGPHRPGAFSDAAQLHAAFLVGRTTTQRQVGRDQELGRRQRSALVVAGYARGLG